MQFSNIFFIAALTVASVSASHSSGPDFSKLISPCPGGLQNEKDDGSCTNTKRSIFQIRGISWYKRAAVAEPAPVAVAVPAPEEVKA